MNEDSVNPVAVEPEPTKPTGEPTQDVESLVDWFQELEDDEAIALFELLATVDPVAVDEVEGQRTFRYSEVQRGLLGEAASVFKGAGFGSE